MTIDFVTIVFDDEINLLFLQAHSLSRYVDLLYVNKIYVVYNDKNYATFKQHFYKTIFEQYGLLKNNVILINCNKLLDKDILLDQPGWRIQQLIKIVISNKITSKYYLVLDTKNHFIRNFDIDFFFKENKCKMFVGGVGVMEKYFTNCLKYFDLTLSDARKKLTNNLVDVKINFNEKLPITITPYLFKTNIVKKLIKYIKTREINFGCFFLNRTDITEFHLYSSFIIYENMLDKFVICDNFNNIAIFNIYPENDQTFISLVEKAINSNIMTFGVHRTRFKILTPTQKQILLLLFTKFYCKEIVEYITNNILYVS